MVAVRRQVLDARHLSGEHGGNGLRRVGVGTRRVAEPRTDGGQLGEARITIGVDRAVAAHDRRGGKLVEHDDDHGSTHRRHVHDADVKRPITGDEFRCGAEEEERRDEQEVGDGERGYEQRAAAGAQDQPREGGGGGERQHQHHGGAVDADPSQHRKPQGGRQQSDDGGVDHRPHRPPEERGGCDDEDRDQRRDERDDQREPHDLPGVVPPGDEELGVASEEVEEWLGHGEAGQPQDHQRPVADRPHLVPHQHRCETTADPAPSHVVGYVLAVARTIVQGSGLATRSRSKRVATKRRNPQVVQ